MGTESLKEIALGFMNVSHMRMLKPGRFNGIEVHRPISYENIICI